MAVDSGSDISSEGEFRNILKRAWNERDLYTPQSPVLRCVIDYIIHGPQKLGYYYLHSSNTHFAFNPLGTGIRKDCSYLLIACGLFVPLSDLDSNSSKFDTVINQIQPVVKLNLDATLPALLEKKEVRTSSKLRFDDVFLIFMTNLAIWPNEEELKLIDKQLVSSLSPLRENPFRAQFGDATSIRGRLKNET